MKNKKCKIFKKLRFFFKRVSPWFQSTIGHFSIFFFFQTLQARNMRFTILQNEKMPFQSIETKLLKVEKLRINLIGQTMVLIKNSLCFHFLIVGLMGQENVFTIFQNQKTPFQSIKNKSSKSRKIEMFLKGLVRSFSLKLAIFPYIFF